MLKRLVLPAAIVLLGCGSADRPAPSDPLVTGGAALEPDPTSAPAAPGEPGEAPRVCEPRSYRDCLLTYVDEDGRVQCPTQVQICSVDGTSWLACGAYVYDENGDPQPHP